MAFVFNGINSRVNFNTTISNNVETKLIFFRVKLNSGGATQNGRILQIGPPPAIFGAFAAGGQATLRGIRIFRNRTIPGNHVVEAGGAGVYDGLYHNWVFFIDDTPAGTHLAYSDGSSETIQQLNNSGTYSTASDNTNALGADAGGFTSNPLDGGISYIWLWDGIPNPGEEILSALSSGVHPNLLGLGTPDIAFEGYNEPIALAGNITTLQNITYESNAGTYLYYPTDSEIDVVTATPPSELQYNLGKHKLQALPITIGAGVGV